MEQAAEKASLVAVDKQKLYSYYFNKRSPVRTFNIEEKVVLLILDSAARWPGPGEIVQFHPSHSYEVKLADGTVRHVQVNKNPEILSTFSRCWSHLWGKLCFWGDQPNSQHIGYRFS
ncbi:hypothetical protein AVEN_252855-1 [Araneus ventricosus]|uniref:Uncharacterized protein n=1 Tax=Araneus ventricosus TaxID=182803 RepID=A0A4Y2NAI8_ARAVE|nr:hypothetical protein AVEN_252855-1 [Araneus ventricosus]